MIASLGVRYRARGTAATGVWKEYYRELALRLLSGTVEATDNQARKIAWFMYICPMF